MWNFVQPRGQPVPSEEYFKFKAVSSGMQMLGKLNTNFSIIEGGDTENNVIANSDLAKKLSSIREALNSKATLFTLLRNVPNMTFDGIFDKLGSSRDNVIFECENERKKCGNFTQLSSGHFARCFQFATSALTNNTDLDDGISNGIRLILMTGMQLMSVAYRDASSNLADTEQVPNMDLFDNALFPSSADGLKIIISSPGVRPNVDELGVDISPGYASSIAISGKEIIRKPWPYSNCASFDYEMQMLQDIVSQSPGFSSYNNKDKGMDKYNQQGCKSACLQRLIWLECGCFDLESRLPFDDIDGSHLCGSLTQTDMLKFLEPGKFGLERCFRYATELVTEKCNFLHKLIHDLACMEKVKESFNEQKLSGTSQCDCNVACHTYEYETSISQAKWPSAGYEADNAYAAYVQARQWQYTFGQCQNLNACGELESTVTDISECSETDTISTEDTNSSSVNGNQNMQNGSHQTLEVTDNDIPSHNVSQNMQDQTLDRPEDGGDVDGGEGSEGQGGTQPGSPNSAGVSQRPKDLRCVNSYPVSVFFFEKFRHSKLRKPQKSKFLFQEN